MVPWNGQVFGLRVTATCPECQESVLLENPFQGARDDDPAPQPDLGRMFFQARARHTMKCPARRRETTAELVDRIQATLHETERHARRERTERMMAPDSRFGRHA